MKGSAASASAVRMRRLRRRRGHLNTRVIGVEITVQDCVTLRARYFLRPSESAGVRADVQMAMRRLLDFLRDV